jgi:hypothetical protein
MENLSGFKYGVRAIKASVESRVMSNGVVVRFYSWADGGLSRKKTPASRFNRVVLTPRNGWKRSGSAVEAQWMRSGCTAGAQR